VCVYTILYYTPPPPMSLLHPPSTTPSTPYPAISSYIQPYPTNTSPIAPYHAFPSSSVVDPTNDAECIQIQQRKVTGITARGGGCSGSGSASVVCLLWEHTWGLRQTNKRNMARSVGIINKTCNVRHVVCAPSISKTLLL